MPESHLDTERFVELGVLGKGGSSVVVRAFDKDLLREVAVKVLSPSLGLSAPDVDRFAIEARITGQLEHPNILPVYELGLDRQGRRFLCMKLFEGKTLEAALGKLGDARLDANHLASLLQVFVKVCDAVSFAHSRGVIHRDLKPTNVMIDDFGQVYLLDWGIARLLPPNDTQVRRVQATGVTEPAVDLDAPGAFLGTTWYMAPEQLQGQHATLDERVDVFALGATLYQILAGRPPLMPDMVQAIWLHRMPRPIPPPEERAPAARVPAELSRIALRATAYAPEDRYASVEDLKRDIERFVHGTWDLPRTALPAGAVIVSEGDVGNTAYVIVEGRCVAYRVEGGQEVVLRTMGAGDVFGELAVFLEKPRTASIKAETDVVIMVVTRDVLSKAVGLQSWMGVFVRALATRFQEADERLRDHARDARNRG